MWITPKKTHCHQRSSLSHERWQLREERSIHMFSMQPYSPQNISTSINRRPNQKPSGRSGVARVTQPLLQQVVTRVWDQLLWTVRKAYRQIPNHMAQYRNHKQQTGKCERPKRLSQIQSM